MNDFDPIPALVKKFPRLFHNKSPQVMSDLPCGWEDLVDRLFVDLDAMLDDRQAKRFKILQIKEKFAGLRVYWQLGSERTVVLDLISSQSVQRLDTRPAEPTNAFDQITARVRQAGAEAIRTCQHCGQPGDCAPQTAGWMVTLCNPCRQKRAEAS